MSPRFAVSTVLSGATLVASYGRFSQAPDYQFLVDAAFDDTTRTGRSRRGNLDVGFEQANQYEVERTGAAEGGRHAAGGRLLQAAHRPGRVGAAGR